MDPEFINSESRAAKSVAGYNYIKEIGNGGYGYVYLSAEPG